ncbi:MAG: hypothetical protein AAB328_09510, partial [candidate division NC10 bacterium]
SLALVDLGSGRVRAEVRFPPGAMPHGVAASPDDRTVFVSLRGRGTVARVDGGSLTTVESAPVGRAPCGVALSPDGRTLVVVDGGVNLLPTAYYFRHDVVAGREVEGDSARVDIVGPLCMQIDVLRRDVSLPPVSRGSILLFRNAGAYTVSNSMQFIYPRPPVVVVSGRETHVLRRGERTEDLVRLDEMPAHLAPRSAASSRNGHKTARANGNGRGHS